MKLSHLRLFAAGSALFVALSGGAPAQAVIVYPDSPSWQGEMQGNGLAVISGINPRSGNGSLLLQTSGNMADWSFYTRFAGDTESASWGRLADLQTLSFDWYRQDLSIAPQYQNDLPWLAQTPVLRILVRDNQNGTPVFSELVWEQYYTDNSAAIVNSWVSENVFVDNMWRHVFGEGYTLLNDQNVEDFSPNPLKAVPVSTWLSLYSADAVVYGVKVGVGSQWPDQYEGYVDNVLLSFLGQEIPAVDDNFELRTIVPEPASILLTGFGAILFMIGRRIKRHSTIS